LGLDGWRIELANLPSPVRKELVKLAVQVDHPGTSVLDALQYCSNLLIATNLDEPVQQQNLKSKATTPDEYNTWQRLIGLYPITALVFRTGISRWHTATRDIFALPLNELPVSGNLVRYAPPQESKQLTSLQISHIINSSFNNALGNNTLGIPEPSDEDVEKLFDSFAPIFEIDVVTNDDRIGTVGWGNNDQVEINIQSPKVYRHISYTRIDENILLQLNYTIWFPSRPKTSIFDLLGGHLDGITWRVTLLANGKPWLYDTMHNCGCYYLVFPTQNASILKLTHTLDEPVLVPQGSLYSQLDLRPILRIAHGSHYIERIYFKSSPMAQTINYQHANSEELRSLKLNDGNYRSLFGQDGIIKSSQRNERYLFWPMGVPSPGAMRQWGHHAIAFVGRRHFDDARLFERFFGIKALD